MLSAVVWKGWERNQFAGQMALGDQKAEEKCNALLITKVTGRVGKAVKFNENDNQVLLLSIIILDSHMTFIVQDYSNVWIKTCNDAQICCKI